MYKLVGSILVVLASSGIGFLKGMDLEKYLGELEQLKKVFLMLRSEIKYTKAPLGEAFSHISGKMDSVWGEWLSELSQNLESKMGNTFMNLWNQSIEAYLNQTRLKKNDIEQLKSLGMNMGCLDEEMQLGTIDLYLEQLEMEIRRTREGLTTKKRLCHCLGVMGGIFLIVILL